MRETNRLGAAWRMSAPIWALITLLACLGMTTAAWYTTKSAVESQAQAEFDFAAAGVAKAIADRIEDYSHALWGGVGLFAAEPQVTREQWKTYVDALNLDYRLPGVQGIGFVQRIAAAGRQAHIAEIRAHGLPDYTVWPPAERDEHTPIVYLEPSDRNNRLAFGYDMSVDPLRRAAMEHARDTRQAAMSGKVTLVQETDTDVQPGFLVYLPVYRPGAATATLDERRAALIGFVYSPFRMRDLLLRDVFFRHPPAVGLGIEIYDGLHVDEGALLYRSAETVTSDAGPATTFTRLLGDRPWTFRIWATPRFAQAIDQQGPVVILTAGILISLLASLLVGMLVINRGRTLQANRRLSADIERHERLQEQLRRSELKFRLLFADNPVPMCAYDRETLKFIDVNNSAVAKYDYSQLEFSGMQLTDIRPPEDIPRLLAARKAHQGERYVGEWRHRLKSGRIIDVEVRANDIELSGRPVTLAAYHDITDRKQAQEALQESERLAREIIGTALDAFVQMDSRGDIVEWNPQAEALFGWSRAEAVGQRLSSLIVPPAFRARHEEGLVRFLQTGDGPALGRRIELEAQRRDGSKISVELSVTAMPTRRGPVFNGFIRDMTEKVSAEEQLRQVQKMEAVGQLTGGVAHDFNNILTVISGTIEILAEAVADQPKLAAITRMIDDAASRGAELTQHLLSFARKQPLQPRETDVNELVSNATKLFRPTLGEQIEIEIMLHADAWPALIDPAQLTTALLNLALNARDAMPEGGKLTLETDNVVLDDAYARVHVEVMPGPYVVIAVCDTGNGIPQALQDKVFEPFFTTKEVGRGTGLGLSMVYGFVKQSGGHIKIYSEEGQGTAVRLYLPRAGGRPESAAESAMEAVHGGPETILVVEDDPLVRKYVLTQLQTLGYRTLAAANASEALKQVEEGAAFDLLFTDVIMPGGINGRQLAEQLARGRPFLKVLYTSGYTENAIIHQGRLDSGVALLTKPYRKAELAQKIRQVLDEAPKPHITPRHSRQPADGAASLGHDT